MSMERITRAELRRWAVDLSPTFLWLIALWPSMAQWIDRSTSGQINEFDLALSSMVFISLWHAMRLGGEALRLAPRPLREELALTALSPKEPLIRRFGARAAVLLLGASPLFWIWARRFPLDIPLIGVVMISASWTVALRVLVHGCKPPDRTAGAILGRASLAILIYLVAGLALWFQLARGVAEAWQRHVTATDSEDRWIAWVVLWLIGYISVAGIVVWIVALAFSWMQAVARYFRFES